MIDDGFCVFMVCNWFVFLSIDWIDCLLCIKIWLIDIMDGVIKFNEIDKDLKKLTILLNIDTFTYKQNVS